MLIILSSRSSAARPGFRWCDVGCNAPAVPVAWALYQEERDAWEERDAFEGRDVLCLHSAQRGVAPSHIWVSVTGKQQRLG